jgi:hypothetical protein
LLYLEWIFRAKGKKGNLDVVQIIDTVWSFVAAVSGIDTAYQNYFKWKVDRLVKEQRGECLTIRAITCKRSG